MTVIALNPPSPKKWDRVRANPKTLAIAVIIELIIIAAVIFAAFQFAYRYSGGDNLQWWMAIICGVVYAAVECARVPLAVVAATHRRWHARWLAIFMLVFAVIITTKSLSQVGEQMFSQRLVEVIRADTALKTAEANNAGTIADHAAKIERIEALDAEIASFGNGLKEFGKVPEAKQVCSVSYTRHGQNRSCRMVTPPWAGATMQQQLVDSRAKRNAMDAEMAAASKARDAATAAIAKARGDHNVAVMDSQLHSFAGMVFMKPSADVTDGEIGTIKLFFVLIGALAGAMTATGLAYCSFTRHPEPKPAKIVQPKPVIPAATILPALRELATELKLEKRNVG